MESENLSTGDACPVPLYFLVPNFPRFPPTTSTPRQHFSFPLFTTIPFHTPSCRNSSAYSSTLIVASATRSFPRFPCSRSAPRFRVPFHNPSSGLHLLTISKSLADLATMSYGGGYNGRGNG